MIVPQPLQVTVIDPVLRQNVQVFSDFLRSLEQEIQMLGGFSIFITCFFELVEGGVFLTPSSNFFLLLAEVLLCLLSGVCA